MDHLIHNEGKPPPRSFEEAKKTGIGGDPSETSSDQTRIRTWTLRSKSCPDLGKIPGNPIITSDHLLEVGGSKNRLAAEEFERKVGVIPYKRGGLLSSPDDVYANDLPERTPIRVTDRKHKSQSERYNVREILRAVVDEQVEIDIVRWDVATGCDRTGERNAVDKWAGANQFVCKFLRDCLCGPVDQSIRSFPDPRRQYERFFATRADEAVDQNERAGGGYRIAELPERHRSAQEL